MSAVMAVKGALGGMKGANLPRGLGAHLEAAGVSVKCGRKIGEGQCVRHRQWRWANRHRRRWGRLVEGGQCARHRRWRWVSPTPPTPIATASCGRRRGGEGRRRLRLGRGRGPAPGVVVVVVLLLLLVGACCCYLTDCFFRESPSADGAPSD